MSSLMYFRRGCDGVGGRGVPQGEGDDGGLPASAEGKE